VTRYLPRVALRARSEYPYSFREDDAFYPAQGQGFGRVIRASRSEGLSAIHEQISEKDKEHAWTFVPEAGLWVDTALSAGEHDVNPDRDLEVYLSHLFPEVLHAHTHPDKVLEACAQNYPWAFSQNYLVEGAIPSVDDVMGSFQMAARSASGCKINNGVVSHYGLTTYAPVQLLERNGCLRDTAPSKIVHPFIDPITAIRGALQMRHHRVVMDPMIDGIPPKPAYTFDFEPLGSYSGR